MQITIFSFLSALLWSSLLIVAIYLLRHTRFKQHFGVLSMVLLYLFCAVRLFLPLEFPHTLIAADGVIYPHIYNLLTRERDMLANKPLVLILCAAWLLGFCELLFRYIRQYRKAIYSVAHYTTPCYTLGRAHQRPVGASPAADRAQTQGAGLHRAEYRIRVRHGRAAQANHPAGQGLHRN